MIAGTGSGCGKTTVACAVLGALKNRGVPLRAFKCGPDYIDPMFHTQILGLSSRNLDSYLCGDEVTQYLFARNSPSHVVSVIEGVMGYYDGLGGQLLQASSHQLAQLLNTPVVLVVSCKGKSLSLAAEVNGFLGFAPNQIVGVILNGASERNRSMYQEIIERNTTARVLGYLPWLPEATLESRHLGLVTTSELEGIRKITQMLAQQAEKTIDLDGLMDIARASGEMHYAPVKIERLPTTVRVGIAQDQAFNFYYRDSLDLLEMLGVRLIPFSPLYDTALPEDIDGLLLGGGYPELYARQLSRNQRMLHCLQQAVSNGLPTIAECGGFMLLSRSLTDERGETWPMAGVLPTDTRMATRLSRFGYVQLTARMNNLFCNMGESIPAHEFHYSKAERQGSAFRAQKYSGRHWDVGYANDTMYAGYPHLHLWGNPKFARNFVQRCIVHRRERA